MLRVLGCTMYVCMVSALLLPQSSVHITGWCRCEHGKEPRAWAFVPPAQEHQKAAAKNLQQHDGQLRQWLRWLQNTIHSIIGWWRSDAPFRRVDGQGKGSEGRGDLEGWDGQDRQRAERVLQQAGSAADRQLSVYPGQTSNGPTGSPRAGTGQGAGQPGGQSQAGIPRPLFRTFSGSTPSATPTPQQLLQVSNNGDNSQQTPPSTPLQTVDPAIAFSALDVGSSPAAITTPSVTIVNNSPCEPLRPTSPHMGAGHTFPYLLHMAYSACGCWVHLCIA